MLRGLLQAVSKGAPQLPGALPVASRPTNELYPLELGEISGSSNLNTTTTDAVDVVDQCQPAEGAEPGSTQVHHINEGPPNYGGPYHREVPGQNLLTLCADCHDGITDLRDVNATA